jgi:hypothetical protein
MSWDLKSEQRTGNSEFIYLAPSFEFEINLSFKLRQALNLLVTEERC